MDGEDVMVVVVVVVATRSDQKGSEAQGDGIARAQPRRDRRWHMNTRAGTTKSQGERWSAPLGRLTIHRACEEGTAIRRPREVQDVLLEDLAHDDKRLGR